MLALRMMKFVFPALGLSSLLLIHPSHASAQSYPRTGDPTATVGLAFAGDKENLAPGPAQAVPQPSQRPLDPSGKPSAASTASEPGCGDADCSGCGGGCVDKCFDFLGSPASECHSDKLYRTPALFGATNSPLTSVGALTERLQTESYEAAFASVPLAGAAGRMNVADNNKALTEDRVFLLYNHFHNALMARDWPGLDPYDDHPLDSSLDRYTIGFEKAFADCEWSVDVRLPLTGRFLYDESSFNMSGDAIGNLGVIFKCMLYEDCETAVAAGVGVEAPTGSDAVGRMGSTIFRVKNEAVHLSPFIGAMDVYDRLFLQAFVSVDVPLNGNTIAYDDIRQGIGEWGAYTEQTLLRVDAAIGYWLYRNCGCCKGLTGLAAVLEIHYLSTLNDTDELYTYGTNSEFLFANYGLRIDYCDFTVGLHADLSNHTALRIGAAFPFRDQQDRAYASEILGQVERRF
jgi:hypothetical protein